jgi:hypothetical protein
LLHTTFFPNFVRFPMQEVDSHSQHGTEAAGWSDSTYLGRQRRSPLHLQVQEGVAGTSPLQHCVNLAPVQILLVETPFRSLVSSPLASRSSLKSLHTFRSCSSLLLHPRFFEK